MRNESRTAALNTGTREARPARLRILIVEDNADAADGLAKLLELDGHETRVALTGAEARSCAVKFAPQLVLVETWLPDMDGCELISILRRSPATAKSTLVVLTGHGDLDTRERAAAAGCDDHLVMPLDLDHLARILRRGRA